MDVYLLLLGTPIVIGSLIVGRALLARDGLTIDDLLRRPELAWPRGVQEEDPTPWRIERLTPGRPRSRTAG